MSKGSHKAESLAHTSVGQRPTYGVRHTIKAESLAHWALRLCARLSALKPFSVSLRRALPYASMCKGFALETAFFASSRRALPYASMCKGFALIESQIMTE